MAESPSAGRHQQELDREFVGGLAWTAAAKWISQAVSWPAVIVSARLLSPRDFGIVDMAGAYFVLANVLAEFGIGTVVLQMRELSARAIAQLNTLSLLFGLLVYCVTALVAPWVADFFHTPVVASIMRWCGISFIMIGVQAVPLAMLQRELDYKRLSITEAIQSVVQAVVTVGSAYVGAGFWSLAFGPLAGRAASLVVTLYWKATVFAWPDRSIMDAVRFGTEIAFQRILWIIYAQTDTVVVGRLLGQAALGSYRLAVSFAFSPAEKIGMLVMRVTGPLFAKLQDDLDQIRRYYLVLAEVLTLGLLPLVGGLVVVAPEAVHILLGPQWGAAVLPLQWLAVFTVIRTLNSLGWQVLTALRYVRFGSWMVVLNAVVMAGSCYVASNWGTGMVAAAWTLMSPITILPAQRKLLVATGCTTRQYMGAMFPAVAGSGVMVGVLVLLKPWLSEQLHPFPLLTLEVILGGAVYAAILFVFFRPRMMRFIHFLRNRSV